MPLRFFNTYSRQLEDFQPRAGNKIDIYTCGPTVYSRAHIGNFRAYIFEDLLQRHLEARQFKVHRVMNITDMDDKTIRCDSLAGMAVYGVAVIEMPLPVRDYLARFFPDSLMKRSSAPPLPGPPSTP